MLLINQILKFTFWSFWNRLNRFAMWPHGFAKPLRVHTNYKLHHKLDVVTYLPNCQKPEVWRVAKALHWLAVNAITGRTFSTPEHVTASWKSWVTAPRRTIFLDMHRKTEQKCRRLVLLSSSDFIISARHRYNLTLARLNTVPAWIYSQPSI